MADKWNSHGTNVFNGFSSPTTQIENGSLPILHQGPGPSHMHMPQPHMVQIENSYIISNDNGKGNFSISSSNEYARPTGNITDLNSHPQLPVLTTCQESVLSSSKSLPHLICFVCSSHVEGKNYSSIKSTMHHSGAPCVVLLMDVLGYKFDIARLHSQVVCKSCIHLLDIIDELQQTLTESKTDVRTKFLETVHRMKLKYPRTDKMLKPRCLRCIQIQSTTRKRPRIGKTPHSKGADEGTCKKCQTLDQANTKAENSMSSIHHESQNTENEETESEIDVDSNTGDDSNITSHVSESVTSAEKSPLSLVFDTDPAFFSPDEKFKVGVSRESKGMTAYHCLYCSTKYELALPLKMHVRVFHMPVLAYDNGQGTPDSKYRMGIKVQNTSEKPFTCLFCESAYKLQSSLQSHFRENHSPNKPFQCLECKDRFRRPIELSRHRLYRCDASKTQPQCAK